MKKTQSDHRPTKDLILEWAEQRELVHYDNHKSQFIKLAEEVGELGSAILKDDQPKIIDAIGDIQVVLIILAEQLCVGYDDCLDKAYEEIKNRKGKTVGGSFIKEA